MKPGRIFFCIVCSFLFLNVECQTKKALIIGINEYQQTPQTPPAYTATRGGWQNLDGCINDATSIKEIIINRYGFEEKNIITIFNKDASNERIKNEIQNLIADAQKGDIIFFYYAGHGSQVKNSKEVDGTGKDQTLVPADFIDIRNKEIAALFNKLLDKGVVLTSIFDCCHSGAIARGNSLPSECKSRDLPASPYDANDPSDPPKIEENGAVVMSAAQRYQNAKEKVDEYGNHHGAFTLSLLQALNSSPVNESAENIFIKTKAIMQSNGSMQEPVFGRNEDRKKKTLFGEVLTAYNGKTRIPVLKNQGPNEIILQGGYASGLNKGCVLMKKATTGSDSIKIELTEMLSVGKSKARLVAGDIGSIKPGDMFECVLWVTSDKPNLRVWFPTSDYKATDLARMSKNFFLSSTTKDFEWVSDPTITAPDYVIQFDKGSWKLFKPNGLSEEIGKNLSPEAIQNKIRKGAKVLLQLPPPASLISHLNLGKNSDNSAIEIIDNPLLADYVLIGRYNNDLSYAWVKPNVTEGDTLYKSSLPLRSDWLNVNDGENIVKLTDYAKNLSTINAWLNLQSPPDDGEFPFTLGLKNAKTGKLVTNGQVYKDEFYGLSLITNEEKLSDALNPRYIYIFAMDKYGNKQLLFPDEHLGNEGNRVPDGRYNNEPEISLGHNRIHIEEPLGFDTYFLLTTDEALNNFEPFISEGVRSRGIVKDDNSALGKLLKRPDARTRGMGVDRTPSNWSIQKLIVRSVDNKTK